MKKYTLVPTEELEGLLTIRMPGATRPIIMEKLTNALRARFPASYKALQVSLNDDVTGEDKEVLGNE